MTLNDFLPRLENVHGRSARCPAHDDGNNSLSVSTGKDGRIILKCHAGCSTEAICAALGLKVSDLFAEPLPAKEKRQSGKRRKFVCGYDYYDLNGKFLYRKRRWIYPDTGKKSFDWIHKDSSGNWVDKRGADPILYNVQATQESDHIYLVEGEKDVETMTWLHFPAVSTPDGAGSDWLPQFTEPLIGKQVTIIQDNDSTGKKFAQRVAYELHRKAACVKILDLTAEWAGLKEHGDITDVLEAEPGGAESVILRLQALETITPAYTPPEQPPEAADETKEKKHTLDTISARELQDKRLEPPRFVVVDLIPQGLSILASPPKYGKSWFVLDMCLSVAAGTRFLNNQTLKKGCLYLALEDSERRLQDRMNKLLVGSRAPDGFDYATSALAIGEGLIEQLEDYIVRNPDVGLIVVDTLQKVRSSTGRGENVYSVDYRDMSILKSLADRHGISVVLVHHLRKMGDDGDPFNRISGSTAILGAADTAMVLSKAKRNDSHTTLSITGRDIESRDTIVEFNKEDYKWHVKGDADWLAEQRAKLSYQQDPIVTTIKRLMEQTPGNRWSGTMQDLFDAGKHIAGVYLAESPRALTNKIKALEKALYEYDGIMHDRAKNGDGGGKHHFYHRTVGVVTEENALF